MKLDVEMMNLDFGRHVSLLLGVSVCVRDGWRKEG